MVGGISMKITVMGFSGSGKSTLAKQLSEFYDIPLLYLDCVNFEENWVERDREECKKWCMILCRMKAGL